MQQKDVATWWNEEGFFSFVWDIGLLAFIHFINVFQYTCLKFISLLAFFIILVLWHFPLTNSNHQNFNRRHLLQKQMQQHVSEYFWLRCVELHRIHADWMAASLSLFSWNHEKLYICLICITSNHMFHCIFKSYCVCYVCCDQWYQDSLKWHQFSGSSLLQMTLSNFWCCRLRLKTTKSIKDEYSWCTEHLTQCKGVFS